MVKTKSCMIRIREGTKQALEPLRKETYAKGKLSYNAVISKLLGKADELKRDNVCKHWVESGRMQDLEILIKTLNKIYEANYDPDDRFKMGITIF